MCDGKYFFSAQTSGGYKNKMKSLSYLISCNNKANNQIPRKLTMVKLLYNGKIEKNEENLSKHGISTLRKVHFH